MKLAGKVAVIPGGNSGIGLATAREFVANGAKVVIFGHNRATLDQPWPIWVRSPGCAQDLRP